MVASIAKKLRMQSGNVCVSPFSLNILISNSFLEEGISLNPEEPYEFEVPVKKSKLLLYTIIACIAFILVYFVLVNEPSSDWPQNLIHLLARH